MSALDEIKKINKRYVRLAFIAGLAIGSQQGFSTEALQDYQLHPGRLLQIFEETSSYGLDFFKMAPVRSGEVENLLHLLLA